MLELVRSVSVDFEESSVERISHVAKLCVNSQASIFAAYEPKRLALSE
jgi:hypothetical protein